MDPSHQRILASNVAEPVNAHFAKETATASAAMEKAPSLCRILLVTGIMKWNALPVKEDAFVPPAKEQAAAGAAAAPVMSRKDDDTGVCKSRSLKQQR